MMDFNEKDIAEIYLSNPDIVVDDLFDMIGIEHSNRSDFLAETIVYRLIRFLILNEINKGNNN